MTTTDNLTTKNEELIYYENAIQKCRDFAGGEDEVKGSIASELYLPMLPGQANDCVNGQASYMTYKEYASVFPAVKRTEESYLGLAFRKPPIVKTPNEAYTEDFTTDAKTMTEFAKTVVGEVYESYRCGVLVDVPETSDNIGTQSEAGVIDRPFASLYKAENILDWSEDRINGELKTTFVKLYETDRIQDPEDEFDFIDIERIRVLDFDGGYYRHRIYESIDNEAYSLVAETYPTSRGNKLDIIPMFPISPKGREWKLDYPPLNDLSNLSMEWYRNSASYENGLLLAGSPTACIGGLDSRSISKEGHVKLGAGSVLLLEEGGQAFFLQIGSEGLAEIKRAMTDKRDEMAVVGARILTGDPNGVEAAETAMIHRAGEHGVIMSVSLSVSNMLSEVLRFMYWWGEGKEAKPDEMFMLLNIDFDFTKMDSQTLIALMGAVQQGKMSNETYYFNLERGELYPPNWSYDKEKEEIVKDGEERQAAIGKFATGDNLAVGAGSEAVEAVTLSGIQISAAGEIIGQVSKGIITREAGVNQLMVFLGLTKDQAESVMGVQEIKEDVGNGEVIIEPAIDE